MHFSSEVSDVYDVEDFTELDDDIQTIRISGYEIVIKDGQIVEVR